MADVSRLTIRRRSPLLAGLVGGAVLVLVSLFWVALAPGATGGTFSYVFTAGNSMEPLYHQGDLVLLRKADGYNIGDIVAFNDPVQGLVLHRIRAREGLLWVTRGDNRGSDDIFKSSDLDIVGRAVFHAPGVGRALASLQTPQNTVILTVATLLIAAAGATRVTSLRRVRWTRPSLAGLAVQDRLAMVVPRRWAAPLVLGSPGGNTLSAGLAVLLAGGALLGAIAVAHGPDEVKPLPLLYEQKSTLEYSAKGAPGLYDAPLASTGDPVFTSVAQEVFLTSKYTLDGVVSTALISDVKGTARLDAEISAQNGWKRTLNVVPETAFNGPTVALTGNLSLTAVRDLIQRMEDLAGVGSPQYRVRIIQTVKGTASVTGQPIDLKLNKSVGFQLDKNQFAVLTGENLTQGEGGSTATTVRKPWVITVPPFGFQVSYEWLRFTAVVSILVSVAGLLVMGMATHLTERSGEAALIEARYADLLVPTDADAIDFGGQLVGVAQFDDLVRMARRTQGSILHCKAFFGDQYLLVEPGVTYLYSVRRHQPEVHA
ncbi:MAG: signal peptidase I [Dehalococcoidia bacterium]